MRVRYGLPLWALLFSVPVALLAINCGPANLESENTAAVVKADDFKQAMDSNVDMAKDMSAGTDMMTDTDANELSLDDGATDSWRRHRWYSPYYYGYGYGYPFVNRWWNYFGWY